MSTQSTVHMDWKCSKNRSYAKTICETSSQAESFAMLHFLQRKKENLVILMMRVRQVPEIVLSSSWKEKEQGLFRINCVFQICHVPLINEVTPSLKNANRVGEICKWMKDHNVSKEQVIVFDDEPNLDGTQDRLVSTSNLSGFQQKHVEQASKLLFD